MIVGLCISYVIKDIDEEMCGIWDNYEIMNIGFFVFVR